MWDGLGHAGEGCKNGKGDYGFNCKSLDFKHITVKFNLNFTVICLSINSKCILQVLHEHFASGSSAGNHTEITTILP